MPKVAPRPELTLAQRIKRKRIAFGLTQAEFAKAMHCSSALISLWERQTLPPSRKFIAPLATFLRMTQKRLRHEIAHGYNVRSSSQATRSTAAIPPRMTANETAART